MINLFDVTNMKTFENIEQWIPLVRKEKDDLPVILVASKCDLEDFTAVSDEQAEKALVEYNLQGYVKTSAKLDFNVDYLFELLIFTILKKQNEDDQETLIY